MKVYQSAAAARTARLPRRNNAVMGSDTLTSIRVVNLRYLPTETGAGSKEQEREHYSFPVSCQKSRESSHMQKHLIVTEPTASRCHGTNSKYSFPTP
jgi:hypothetical protein